MTTKHVYAIIRSDDFLDDCDIQSRITVKKVVLTLERANLEVERLNKTNANKQCHYFHLLTRLEIEDGM